MTVSRTDRGTKQQIESAAIVLDCRDHGESDKIITFFGKGLGRMTGIAKGAKRSKKRFVNKLEIFSSLLISHTLPQNGRLAFIAEAELLDGFLNLRTHFSCYSTASIIQEVILLATKEQEGDDELFPLLLWAYESLDSLAPPGPVLISFLIRLFAIIGYSPELEQCVDCGHTLVANETYQFYPHSGGIHCSKCNKKQQSNRIQLSCGTLRSLGMARQQPLERLHRLQFTEQSQREALSFLHVYGLQLFQRDIVSWSFLD